MSGLLELEIKPGICLGGFKLGMTISEVISTIKALGNKTIERADIKFSEDVKQDIVIDLTKNGVLFRFDALVQRLYVIEIYKLSLLTLKYNSRILNSVEERTTFRRVHSQDLFGYFFFDEKYYHKEQRTYNLIYQGICFVFEMPIGFKVNLDVKKPKLEIDEGCDPEAKRILIFPNSASYSPPKASPIIQIESNFKPNFCVRAEIGKGIEIGDRKIHFGISSQSVLYEIGSPSKIYFKKSHQNLQNNNFEKCDFFFNYFDFGFDLMFDGVSKCLTKIILHTNYPNHHHFNRYTKCNFQINLPEWYPGEPALQPEKKEIVPKNNNDEFLIDIDEDPRRDKLYFVTPETKWSAIIDRFGECGYPLNPRTNIHLFGYKGVIFEILDNNCIASVLLFPF